MASRKRTDAETWAAIENARADDYARELLKMSREEVDKELRDGGLDPAAVRAKGSAFVAELRERHSRLGWHAAAHANAARVRGILEQRKAKYASLPRKELEARITAARSDPRFGGQVAMMFRNREAGKSSDEELAEILERIDALGEIAEQEGAGAGAGAGAKEDDKDKGE